jgi:putative transposase
MSGAGGFVGWAIREQMTAELVLAALNMALQQRKLDQVIHHSDQASQYTSVALGKRCENMGVRPSMGSVGDAYDNAIAESFFATLECKLIDRRVWQTKTEARLALFTFIEGWYNPRRRHSALGQTSPVIFEQRFANLAGERDRSNHHGIPTGGVCVEGATPPVDIPQSMIEEIKSQTVRGTGSSPDNPGAVTNYVAKYVVKDQDIEFSESLTHYREQLPLDATTER